MDEFNDLFDDHLFDIDKAKGKTIKLKDGERRMVSIIFADVKGFTALSEKIDHEDIQSLMDHIMKIFSHSIEIHGGYVDKYTGDQIMGLFGAKVASEVDTERAISCGLDIISKLNKFNQIASTSDKYKKNKIDLSIRVGINTGMVTTGKIGKEREGDYTVYGDSVNLASRMESNAPVNSIMIPDYTMNLVKNSFEFIDNGEINVKGKTEPISVYIVESKKDKKILHVSPFVGRDEELEQLNKIYLKCNKYIKTGMTDKMTIVGMHSEAGVGKSRLVYEFLSKQVNLDIDLYSMGSCSNVSSQPYNLFITLIKDSFEISILDNKEVIKDKIESGIKHLISLNPGRDKQLHDSKVFLALLLGVKYDDERLNDKKEIVNHIRISIRIFIECLCNKANEKNCAFIIIMEDIHWIDNMSMQTLEYLLQTFNIQGKRDSSNLSVPLFICTYRTEHLLSEKITSNSIFIDTILKPLNKESSLELIEQLTNDINLNDKKIIELYEKSSGNPFFIEEWVSLIKEKNISDKVDRSRELIDDYSIPNTLNSLILSRIDSLEKDLRLLLQKATIIGEEFFLKILSLLEHKLGLKEDIKEPVDNLESENFIQHFLKQIDQYKFKHILTRDVAYSTILKSNRRILHKSVAEVIEESFSDIIEKFYYELAVHYDHAQKYDKAINYLEKSGDKFQYLLDMENALLCYKRIIEIFNEQNMKKNNIYYLAQSQIGKIYGFLGETNKSISLLNSLINNKDEISKAILAKIYLYIGDVYENKRENDLSLENYNNSFELSKELNNNDLSAELNRCIGIIMMNTGHFDKALKYYKKHMNHFVKEKNKVQVATITGNIGLIHFHQGKLDESYNFFEKQHQICEELDSKQLLQHALGNMALINNIKGEYKSAIAKFDDILTICEDINDIISISNTLGNIGIAYKNIGEYDMAIKQYEMQLSIAEKSQFNSHICSANTNMGVSYYHKGNFKKSYEFYQKSEKIINKINDKNQESILYGNKGMLLFDMGKLDDALNEYQKSYDIFSSLNNIRGEALIHLERAKILFYKNNLIDSEKEIIKSCKIFESIGDLPNYSKSLIQYSKIDRKLNKIDEANKHIKQAYDISYKIKLDNFINEANVEQEIINMYKYNNPENLLSLIHTSSLKLGDELVAYIHYNLWQHDNLESSKKSALNLYSSLYKKFPKKIYEDYINDLS
tara:strand:- start:160 stop:3726 length:3567 start_codon:yes stop_codon:yes gene_type:complete